MLTEMDTFEGRLKFVRKTHKLTYDELSEYCGTTKSTLNYWEYKRTIPTFDRISIIADIFGGSLDWFAVRSDVMYREDTILRLEAKLSEVAMQLPVVIPESYQNEELRKTRYSLDERGKIVFLLNVLSYEMGKEDSKKVKKYIAELEEMWSE